MTTSFFEATPQIRRWTDAVRELAESEALPVRAGRWIASIVASFIIIQYVPPLAYHLSINNIVSGIALGSLYGIIGVGIVLIYKTNRIINFAAGAIGAVPATAALMLTIQGHLSYLAALPIAVIGGPLVGALTDMVVMRRFAKSPRLILTVITLGVAQSLAILSFYIPIWLGARAGEIARVQTPWISWGINDSRGQPIIRGDQIFALIVVCALTAMLAFFLRYTRLGIALRASAENSDRAELLGIPVRRVGMVAWMLAGLLSALAIYVQSPLIGVPQDATLGFDTLLYGLAAAIVARMERLSVCLAAGMGIGVIIFGSIASTGSSNLASATMLVVILGALLLVRKGLTRAQDSGVSTWQSVKEYRRIPHELTRLWEVQAGRVAVVASAVGLAVLLPFIIGAPDVPSLTLLPLYGIVAVSLVVLTGWAGQISLGQFAVVGMAAAVAGGVAANH